MPAESGEKQLMASKIIIMRTEGEDAPPVERGETPKEIYISGTTGFISLAKTTASLAAYGRGRLER
jgi:hypothetical protein